MFNSFFVFLLIFLPCFIEDFTWSLLYSMYHLIEGTGAWREHIFHTEAEASPARCGLLCEYMVRSGQDCDYFVHDSSTCYLGNYDAATIIGLDASDAKDVFVRRGALTPTGLWKL